MNGLALTANCAATTGCTGTLEYVTGGTCADTESRAVMKCATCGARWLVVASLRRCA